MRRNAIGKWAALAVGALSLLVVVLTYATAQPRRGDGARTVRGTVRSFTSAPNRRPPASFRSRFRAWVRRRLARPSRRCSTRAAD